MAHQYKLLHSELPEELDYLVNQHMEKGWELWGNPFATVFPPLNVRTFYQAVVHFDPSGHEIIGNVETALREPAGYTIGVPETPSFEGPCACLEKKGDNPDCPVHCEPPISSAISAGR